MFSCTEKDCRVDCVISPYEPSNCSAQCGLGVVMGTARILIHPENGGEPCPPLEIQLDECHADDCRKFWIISFQHVKIALKKL